MSAPSTDPIEYLVLRNLQAALQAISLAAGYYYDVPAGAVKLDPDSKPDDFVPPMSARPFILIDVDQDLYSDYSSRPTRVKIDLPVTIYWINDSDPTVDESLRLVYARGCADIEKAITADIQRGGLAYETRIAGRHMGRRGAEVWAKLEAHLLVGRGYGHPV